MHERTGAVGLVMAVAKGNNSSPYLAICHKDRYLTEAILDSTQICNLEDRYLLGEQLGWGQFGVIRSCSDKLTGEILACKSIAKDKLVTLEDVRSVKLEIEIMARLSGHPNIVDLKAVFEEEDYVHLVMELCAGGELFHRIDKHGAFSESDAAVLFKQLMEVVMYCHDKGVVHRDLKPENILLATTSKSSPIKLADFGLATYIRPGTCLNGVVGSPFYIAPEVLAGGYNQAADVWSAGVILYILLSRVPPFWGQTKSKIFNAVRAADVWFMSDPWDRISASAKDLIMGMLCRDPSQRLTARQVLDHCWIKNGGQIQGTELHFQSAENPLLQQPISAHRDFSLSSGNTAFVNAPKACSPMFTCNSSFSSFVINAAASSPSVGFSFRSCESTDQEFTSPMASVSSFAFFSPSSHIEQEKQSSFTDNTDNLTTIDRDLSFGKMLTSAPATHGVNLAARKAELREIEIRKAPTRPSGIHSRRNHTIGLGELEQLDLMVTESVIRWASCTNLSSAASLRSSLVC
ncbi:calcium-dependent protein kinase 26 isoform X1 [Nymphaea colorata]|nr:calcium-dependent protein kinase 26 isoform X1 [Nymphaea colorata]